MNRPEWILFDYGQTLGDEAPFDGLAGTQALLAHADNPKHVTAKEVQIRATELNHAIGRFEPGFTCEITQAAISRALYEPLDIHLNLSPLETEEIFWDHASPVTAAPGAAGMLAALRAAGIRTGIVSNMSYSGEALKRRLARLFPEHSFAFVMTSSDYVFCKPHPEIFRMALHKTNAAPQKVWFIGDNGLCDVDGSAAMGMKPFWYRGLRPGSSHEPTVPCHALHTWQELLELLDL